MSNTAYMVVNPGVGWLENALPEATLLSDTQVLIFCSGGALLQFLNHRTCYSAFIHEIIYPSGIPVPKAIRCAISVCGWLVRLKSPHSSRFGLRMAAVFYALGELRWSQKLKLETGFLLADFHTVNLERLGYFCKLFKLHIPHGFHCRLEGNSFYTKNLKSIDQVITWNIFQAQFYELQGMNCLKKPFAKLNAPVFVGSLSKTPCLDDKKVVLYLGRPITREYISAKQFERIFKELAKAIVQVNGYLLIKPHPKEVFSSIYFDLLRGTKLKQWSIVNNPIMSFVDLDIQFAFALYTGTCIETSAMGVPNGQLLGLNNCQPDSPVDVFEYIDAGLTEDCSGLNAQDFVKMITDREQYRTYQARSVEGMVFDY